MVLWFSVKLFFAICDQRQQTAVINFFEYDYRLSFQTIFALFLLFLGSLGRQFFSIRLASRYFSYFLFVTVLSCSYVSCQSFRVGNNREH